MVKKVEYVGVDTSLTQPSENDVLVFRNGEWVSGGSPNDTITLDNLKDVDISGYIDLTDDYVLAYDVTTGKWKPKLLTGGGLDNGGDTVGDLDGGGFSTIDPTEPDYDGGGF